MEVEVNPAEWTLSVVLAQNDREVLIERDAMAEFRSPAS